MPGQASIKWTDSNMAKALHAMIGMGYVKIDDVAARKIANYLGNGCQPHAIKNLLMTRRQSFKPLENVTAQEQDDDDDASVAPKKRKAKGNDFKVTKVRKVNGKTKTKKVVVSDMSENDEEDEVGFHTPPGTPIKRESPRKSEAVDYSILDGTADEDASHRNVESDDSDGDEYNPLN